jgi:hypothetical protein
MATSAPGSPISPSRHSKHREAIGNGVLGKRWLPWLQVQVDAPAVVVPPHRFASRTRLRMTPIKHLATNQPACNDRYRLALTRHLSFFRRFASSCPSCILHFSICTQPLSPRLRASAQPPSFPASATHPPPILLPPSSFITHHFSSPGPFLALEIRPPPVLSSRLC